MNEIWASGESFNLKGITERRIIQFEGGIDFFFSNRLKGETYSLNMRMNELLA